MSSSNTATRLRFVSLMVFLFGCVLIGKLYVVTVVHGEMYRHAADQQYQKSVGGLFDRGSIYFVEKTGREIGAATLATGAVVAINPKIVAAQASSTFAQLAEIIPLDKDVFFDATQRASDTYREVARRIREEDGQRIKALRIPGVIVSEDRWRTYAALDMAAHTIGFVGWDGDRLVGQYGLERYYEHVLRRGTDSAKRSIFAGLFDVPTEQASSSSDAPGSIVVSIEPTVQVELEKTLAAISDRWSIDEGGGVVLDPQTGEVLALAAVPSFDPNMYARVKDVSLFANPLVEHVYEMGSIMKPVTMALGLDAGVVTPTSTYTDKGFLELDGKTIRNFDGKGRGVVGMQEVLNKSLNTGAAHVALLLGAERFISGVRSFGIGEETGIDLPNELPGLITNLNSKRDVNVATASYGQGIAVTPIMMARALATLGNGGMLINPHVIKEIRYEDGSIRRPDYSSTKRVISEETSDTITRMLVTVVDEALLHGKAKLPRYTVAAKTGTAQIANPAGGYYDDRYLNSFFGYFPAHDPKFLVFLYAVHPKGATYASETLTEPFMDMTRFLLSYYSVPPDR